MITDIARQFNDLKYVEYLGLLSRYKHKDYYNDHPEEVDRNYDWGNDEYEPPMEIWEYINGLTTDDEDDLLGELYGKYQWLISHIQHELPKGNSETWYYTYQRTKESFKKVLWAERHGFDFWVIYNPMTFEEFALFLKGRKAIKLYEAKWEGKTDREFLLNLGYIRHETIYREQYKWCKEELHEDDYIAASSFSTKYSFDGDIIYLTPEASMAFKLKWEE